MDLELNLTPFASKKQRSTFFCFKNQKARIQTLHDRLQIPENLIITGFPQEKLRILIFLAKAGVSHVDLMISSFHSWKTIKKTRIHIKNCSDNQKIVLKSYLEANILLFYYESVKKIEIRRTNSLKLLISYDVSKIYQYLIKKQDIISRNMIIDIEYLSNLKTVAISFGPYILLTPENNYENESRIGYDSECQGVKDSFKTLIYDGSKSRLFAAGLSSLVMLEFESANVVSRSRLFRHEKITRASRYLSWDPTVDMLLMVENVDRGSERLNVFKINREELEYVKSVSDMALFSQNYNFGNKLLTFQDTSRKNVIRLSLADLLTKDSEYEGEVIFQVPEFYQKDVILNFFYSGFGLIAKPVFDIHEFRK